MKIVLGTAGIIAAGLFLTAPNASAEALPLQNVDIGITGSGIGPTGSGAGVDSGAGPEAVLGLGSVNVGSSALTGPFIDFGSVRVPLG
ncbi:hypothetical protein [Nocardia aurantiaca]|uniref:PPE family protein n=1 Tax=Nocardia aurantiaca TaxID=2675850 RepID=A0A6I3KVQ3_9NOCA|nr:hypothetical protein [Nocardia aurantiaca]MTE12630.1 hypothetical protein [Nocardia aurantiaca]